MSVSKRFGMVALAISLSACTSYRGADDIGSQAHVRVNNGSIDIKDPRIGAQPSISLGLADMFRDDLVRAIRARYTNVPEDQTRLLNSGFALIQSNCNAYFNEMGRNQRNSRATRSLVAPVSTLLSALIGLQLFSGSESTNNDLITGFSAVSAAGSAVLDTYDNHFLFGAENIGVVHTMTMSALSASREAILAQKPTDVVNTIARLQDNERICTPAQILNNARDSIKTSDFKAKAEAPASVPTPEPAPPAVVPPPPPADGSAGSAVVTVSAT